MSAGLKMQVLPLEPMGAEVKGVNLARPSALEVEAIKEVWYCHDVLVFRNQQLTDDDLLSFSRHFLPSTGPRIRGRDASRPQGIPRYTSSRTCSTSGASRSGLSVTAQPTGTLI